MALEFYNLDDTKQKQVLFTWSDADLEAIGECLLTYKQQTGLHIDAYGTNRIYPDHVNLLSDLIDQQLSILNNQSQHQKQLKRIRDEFKQVTDGLLAIGD
jgi:REP element-mobilizing transposase RayT